MTATVPRVAPQPKGVVPPKVEKRLAELAAVAKESDKQLRAEAVAAIHAGGSFREVHRITGASISTLQRWVRDAGGLPRAETERAYQAERRRILDEVMGPVREALAQLERDRRQP